MKTIISFLLLALITATFANASSSPVIWGPGPSALFLAPATSFSSSGTIYGGINASDNLTLASTSDSTKGTVFISPNTTGKVSINTAQTSYPFQYGDFTGTSTGLSGSSAPRTWAINDSTTTLTSPTVWKSFNFILTPNIGSSHSTAQYRAFSAYAGQGQSSPTDPTNTSLYYAVLGTAELRTTGGVGDMYGGSFTSQLTNGATQNGSNPFLYGSFNTASCLDSTCKSSAATFSQSQTLGTGTIINQYGNRTAVAVGNTAAVTNAWGYYTRFDIDSTATLTNAVGMEISHNFTGTPVTNGYGIKIGTIKGSAQQWALYTSDATDPSYFAGNVLIGTAGTATATFDVEGGTAAAATNGANIILKAQDAGTGTQNGGNIFIRPGALSGSGTNGTVSVATTETSYPFQFGNAIATSASIGTLRNWVVNYAPTLTSGSIFGNTFVTQPNIGTTASTATYYSLYGYSGTGTAINNGATPNFTGVYGIGDLSAAGTANEIVGVNGSGFIVGSGSATSVIGVKTRAQIFNTSTATNLKGFDLSVSTNNTAAATNAYGFLIANTALQTSTVGTMYGVNISNTKAAGATITTSYGVYVGALDATTKYSIFTTDIAAPISLASDLILSTAGKGLQIKEGSNARMGTSTLSGGTVTVSNTSVTANTRIFITKQDCANNAAVRQASRVASTSFTITSADGADTCVVAWQLIEPTP